VGATGAPGAAGSVFSFHTATLGQSRPGAFAGLLLHEFNFPLSPVGKVVRVSCLLSVNSPANIGTTPILNVGGMVCEFMPIVTNGARLVRFQVEMHVRSATYCEGGVLQANAANGVQGADSYSRRVSVVGACVTNLVKFSIKGTLPSVEVLSLAIELV
jgi:hypothetical protein